MDGGDLFVIKALVLLVVVVVVGSFILGFGTQIPAGQVGILTEFGAAKTELSPGFHFLIPMVSGVTLMDMRTTKILTAADSASKDLQIVHSSVSVNLHIADGNALKIYSTIGVRYQETVLAPALEEAIKASTAQFTAEELVVKRDDAKAKIKEALQQRLKEYGFVVETINIENFKFSPSFDAAIEAKVTAQQNALKAENDLQRVKFEAQQKVMAAQGDADSVLLRAKADAEAISLRGESIRANPQVVQLEYINKWNGAMPMVYGSSSSMMMMLPQLNQSQVV